MKFLSIIMLNLATDISSVTSKYDLPLVMVGDFNSRSGTLDDFADICDDKTFLLC